MGVALCAEEGGSGDSNTETEKEGGFEMLDETLTWMSEKGEQVISLLNQKFPFEMVLVETVPRCRVLDVKSSLLEKLIHPRWQGLRNWDRTTFIAGCDNSLAGCCWSLDCWLT